MNALPANLFVLRSRWRHLFAGAYPLAAFDMASQPRSDDIVSHDTADMKC